MNLSRLEHQKERLEQRYNRTLTLPLYKKIVSKIKQSKNIKNIRINKKYGYNRIEILMEFEGEDLRLIWDSVENMIVTFLPIIKEVRTKSRYIPQKRHKVKKDAYKNKRVLRK